MAHAQSEVAIGDSASNASQLCHVEDPHVADAGIETQGSNTMKTVRLAISPAENQPGYYLVVVNGEGFFESIGATVGARIRGDDTWFDDRLFSIGGTGYERVLPGGLFFLSAIVPSSELNEDLGRDEIYALVAVDGLSGTFQSNTVTGHF